MKLLNATGNRAKPRKPRQIQFILLTLSLSLAAMLISFGVVRYLTHRMDVQVQADDPVAQHRSRLLRDFANELTISCNDYVRLVDTERGLMPLEAKTWIERIFRRDIRFLEQRMDANPMTSIPPFIQLRSAVARCAGMARHSEDQALRKGALRDAARAISEVNAYIEAQHMAHWAGRTPVKMNFE